MAHNKIAPSMVIVLALSACTRTHSVSALDTTAADQAAAKAQEAANRAASSKAASATEKEAKADTSTGKK